MILEDKDSINIGHLLDDWVDKGPDASKVSHKLYQKANGHVFLFNGSPYITNDSTDYMMHGNQSTLSDW